MDFQISQLDQIIEIDILRVLNFYLIASKKIENFTDEKLNIEIITGVTIYDIADYNLNGEKKCKRNNKFLRKFE